MKEHGTITAKRILLDRHIHLLKEKIGNEKSDGQKRVTLLNFRGRLLVKAIRDV